MSHKTEHKIYVLAESRLNHAAINAYLIEIGAIDKALNYDSINELESLNTSDEHSGLIEFLGRLCYRSFKPGLNKNVTKVRDDNTLYLDNVLKSKHGSILEHCTVTFLLHNVSRVLTHELVRHRAGTAFSQESLRYVRIEDLGYILPSLGGFNERANSLVATTFKDVFSYVEQEIGALYEALEIDEADSFNIKKTVTSLIRRLAPQGMSTAIAFTANHRALRNIIEQRCTEAAEVEIRAVVFDMAIELKSRYPNIYQDLELDHTNKTAKFKYEKV
jgi:thymidylate synthase (FAD)